MFRGSQQARIDDKGRLKVPSDFRTLLEQQYGPRLFVTSFTGESVLVYPLPVWEQVEQKILALPSTMRERTKLLDAVNYYGVPSELDAQGRVLIPPKLRDRAAMVGEVDVMGKLTLLEVWNHERLRTRVEDDPLSSADLAALAAAGL